MTTQPTTRLAIRAARRARKQRLGQTMVLGVITLGVMAFMMMASFNVANAVQQKIRLQSHSDSLAYSIAVVEARAFNYYAYSNRAIAAVLVAQVTLHAYHSISTQTADLMMAAMFSFIEIALIELGLCCACPWCACVWHCIDAIQAAIIAYKYYQKAGTWANKVRGRESDFNRSVKALAISNGAIHAGQMAMGVFMTVNVLTGNEFSQMKNTNMKCAGDQAPGLSVPNIQRYACALEGAITDILCVGPGSTGKLATTARSKIMANEANASRTAFAEGRLGTGATFLGPTFIQEMQNVPGSGISYPPALFGSGRIAKSKNTSDCADWGSSNTNPNQEGKAACASDVGTHFAQWRHGVGGMVTNTYVASDDSSGKHTMLLFRSIHSGQHGEFKQVQKSDPMFPPTCVTDQGNCFINFRSNPNGQSNEFQQPKTYAGVSGSLRDIRDACGKRQPWEMFTNGKKTIKGGQNGDGVLVLTPQQDAYALSKAMVYYHRFDSWKMAPNMFDPYWRAKLHPFTKLEAGVIAGLAADPSAPNAIGPVEGK